MNTIIFQPKPNIDRHYNRWFLPDYAFSNDGFLCIEFNLSSIAKAVIIRNIRAYGTKLKIIKYLRDEGLN